MADGATQEKRADEIVFNIYDLPKVLVLRLPGGEEKKFVIDYAKRTKGLYLNRVEQ